jgi:hypothetical protein
MPPESPRPGSACGGVCIDTIAIVRSAPVIHPLYGAQMGTSRPLSGVRIVGALVRGAERRPWLTRAALSPVVARPGYWLASAVGLAWGAALSVGRLEQRGGVVVARGMPRWAFGRGGTTIGAVYLTATNDSDPVLRHEAVHRDQWKKYGLAFIPLYFAAGQNAATNRFEREAGLRDGGYR